MKLWIAGLVFIGAALCGAQQRPQSGSARAKSCSKEVRAALIEAVRSTNQMTASGPALAWELEKAEAEKSVNLLVGLAETPAELRAAGFGNDALSQRELCKLQIEAAQGSDAFGQCLKKANQLDDLALDSCGISQSRTYPHGSE